MFFDGADAFASKPAPTKSSARLNDLLF
jgi:hypothetical protein